MSFLKRLKFGMSPPVPSDHEEYVRFANLRCVDAEGHVFEEYPELFVRKDEFRKEGGSLVNRSLYAHAVYCEENSMFLPSFALTCQIVAACYSQKANPAYAQLLQQYNNNGSGTGWHGQNTVINFSSVRVIHYPNASDFSERNAVNTSQTRIALPFEKSSLEDVLLQAALSDSAALRYVRQLTGLADPFVLVEIGEYFHKPAKVWFPWVGKKGAQLNQTVGVWFGCYGTGLNLDTGDYLNNNGPARGVRRFGERSEPGAGDAR